MMICHFFFIQLLIRNKNGWFQILCFSCIFLSQVYKCCWAMGWIVKLSHKSQILKFTFSHGEFWGYTGRWDKKLSLNIRTETNIWMNTILWLLTVYHNHHLCSKKKSIEKWKYKNKIPTICGRSTLCTKHVRCFTDIIYNPHSNTILCTS